MIDEENIPNDWDIKQIKDVLDEAKNGGTPKRSNQKYWGGDIDWLSSGEIRGHEVRDADESITKSGLSESSAKMFPEDSVLVAMYGDGDTKGRSVINRTRISGNQAICCLVPGDDIRPKYLLYYIKYIKDDLRSLARGGGQDNLNQGLIIEQNIPVPSLMEQDSIIQAIEERINNITELENSVEQIRSLSQEYENSLIAFLLTGKEKLDEGNVDGLPSEEVVPEEWEIKQLGDVVEYHSNLIDPSNNPEKEYTLIELDDVEKNGRGISNIQYKKGENIGSNKREFNENHVLYCKLRPYLNKVAKPSFTGIATSELLVFEPEEDVSRDYLYHYLSSPMVCDKAEFLMKGANHPRISKAELMSFNIPIPPKEKQEELVSEIRQVRDSGLDEMIDRLNELFHEYRKSVLYHAYTGEFGTPDNDRGKQLTISEID